MRNVSTCVGLGTGTVCTTRRISTSRLLAATIYLQYWLSLPDAASRFDLTCVQETRHYDHLLFIILVCFGSHTFVRAPFAQTLTGSTREGRPVTVVEVWAQFVQCGARGVRSKFFLPAGGVDKTITGVSILRRYFVSSIIRLFSVFFAHIIRRISLKTARLAISLGFLWRDRFGVHYHLWLGVLRAVRLRWANRYSAVCRVSRVHTPCAMRYFFLSLKKKTAAGFTSFGATLSMRTRVPAPANVAFFFARVSSRYLVALCSNIERILSVFATARLATTLPSLCRDRFEVCCHTSMGACAVCHACMFRV